MHTLTCTIELFHAPSSRNWCTTLTIFSITHTHNAPFDVDFSTTAYSYLMIVTVLECTHRVLLMLLITLIVEIITCPSFVHRRPSQRYRLVRFYFVFLNGLSLSAVEWPTPKVLQLHFYARHTFVHASVGESHRFACVCTLLWQAIYHLQSALTHGLSPG